MALWKVKYQGSNKLTTYAFAKDNSYSICKSCSRPDIYLLVFDEYGSSLSLKQRYDYDNSGLDSFLIHCGFHIMTRSRSNYNFTPFSIASLLNMSYLQGLRNPLACTLEDYNTCDRLIRNNEVIKYLSYQGYDIVNYSVFELAGNPSKIEQTLLPLQTKLITDRTLWSYLQKDIGWMLFTGKYKIKWLEEETMLKQSKNNDKLIDLVKKESGLKTSNPKFVYAHFFMPHPPYFYDQNFRQRNLEKVFGENDQNSYQSYLNYIPYTNLKAKELINAIKSNSHDSAVIILMGDHGFRHITNAADISNLFQNQNAVFFPDSDYAKLSDSITNVNEFRVVFNKLFHAGLPILKDSSVYLQDKK